MQKICFLPQWYLKNKINKNKKMMKIFIATIIIIDLICIDILISRLSKIKLIEDKINYKVDLQHNKDLQKNEDGTESNKTLDTFYAFVKNAPSDINYENIQIENNKLDIEINSESFDYINFIDELEAKDQFVVKNLALPSEGEGKNIKANLELK